MDRALNSVVRQAGEKIPSINDNGALDWRRIDKLARW